MKEKICNTEEEYLGLMRTLERYDFHWQCGQKPTDSNVLNEIGHFPVKVCFGFWGEGSKKITFSHAV